MSVLEQLTNNPDMYVIMTWEDLKEFGALYALVIIIVFVGVNLFTDFIVCLIKKFVKKLNK